jgi:periplasmic protein TonB
MFEDTLLDSSASRKPILAPAHWLASALLGILGFVAGAMLLPVAPTPSGTRVLLVRAAILGILATVHALAVCYVFLDARRAGLRPQFWAIAVFLTSLPGFLVYLVYSALRTGNWKRATLPIAYTVEVLFVGIAALVPLIYTQALPGAYRFLLTPLPPVPRGAAPRPSSAGAPRRATPRTNVVEIPRVIPHGIHNVLPEPPQAPDLGPGIPGLPPGLSGEPDGVIFSVLSDRGALPQLPAPRPETAQVKRVTIGGRVAAAKAIFTPQPEYPYLAKIAHIEGTVVLKAIISTDGTIQELRAINGHPFLIPAAEKAVERWRYQPTLLNEEPVEVETQIEVTFILGQ